MKKSIQAALCAVLLAAAGASAAQTKLTLGYNAAPGNPRDKGAHIFADRVKELTGGELVVQVAGGAQLGDEPALVTGMRTGSIDLSPNVQGAVSAVVPEVNAFGMPFLFGTNEQAWRAVDDPELMAELSKKFEAKGLILLGFMDQGIRHVSNSKKPLKTVADFHGLKIRTPADPVTVDIFRQLGADPQQIKFPELYMALQQGVVDAQENPLMNIDSSKLYEVQKYISFTGHKWESSPFLMSKRTWDRLTDPQRQAIRTAAAEAIAQQRQMVKESDQALVDKLKADGVQFDQADLPALRAAMAPVLDKWERSDIGPFLKRVREIAARP